MSAPIKTKRKSTASKTVKKNKSAVKGKKKKFTQFNNKTNRIKVEEQIESELKCVRKKESVVAALLYPLYLDQEKMFKGDEQKYAKKNGEFSFTIYLIKRFEYQPSTAMDYVSAFKLLDKNNYTDLPEGSFDITKIRYISSVKDERKCKKLIIDMAKHSREELKAKVDKINKRDNPPTETIDQKQTPKVKLDNKAKTIRVTGISDDALQAMETALRFLVEGKRNEALKQFKKIKI